MSDQFARENLPGWMRVNDVAYVTSGKTPAPGEHLYVGAVELAPDHPVALAQKGPFQFGKIHAGACKDAGQINRSLYADDFSHFLIHFWEILRSDLFDPLGKELQLRPAGWNAFLIPEAKGFHALRLSVVF
jgi:hypothetical protein